MKIDVHWHHVPAQFVDAVLSGRCPIAGTVDRGGPDPVFVLGGGTQLRLSEGFTHPDAALAAMDDAGLDAAAVSMAPPLQHYAAEPAVGVAVCRAMNDAFAELAHGHGGRFLPLANLPMQDPGAAVEELRRSILELGLSGAAIGTNVAGRNLGDAAYLPFWRAVAEMDAFVFLHPVTPMGGERLARHELRNFVGFPVDTAAAIASLMFDGVYEEVGPLKTCFAHGGGAFPALFRRWEHGYRARIAPLGGRVREPRAYLGSVYVDSLTHGERELAFVLDLVGADHVLLGSDFPFNMGDPQPVRSMERAVADEATRALVGGATAARLLGVDADRLAAGTGGGA